MKNSKRILDSIGKLDDSMIESALSYESADKSSGRVKLLPARPIRKLAIGAIAAALFLTLTITCFANADGIQGVINSIFHKEQELIDPYAAMIEQSDEKEGISMTVDKIVKDTDRYVIYLHLRCPDGFKPGFLIHNGIEIEQLTSTDGWQTRAEFPGTTNAEVAILSGTSLTEVETETQDIDVMLFMNEVTEHIIYGDTGTKFRLSIYDPSTAQIFEEGGGTPKTVCTYVDKLTVEFEFDESKIESLPESISYPNIDFEVEGTTFRLTELRYTSLHIQAFIEDPVGGTFELDGIHYYNTDKITSLYFSEEYSPLGTHTNEEWQSYYTKAFESGLFKKTYSIFLEDTAGNIIQTGGRTEYQIGENGRDVNKLIFTVNFDQAMYEDEIKSLGFGIWVCEDDPPTAESEYSFERITVWNNPNCE